jgi:hypothetical protein
VTPVGSGVAGKPKNLIFASNGPKPEIGFRDAINNDIVILSHEESCLVGDRHISDDGLLWSVLVDWWRTAHCPTARQPPTRVDSSADAFKAPWPQMQSETSSPAISAISVRRLETRYRR